MFEILFYSHLNLLTWYVCFNSLLLLFSFKLPLFSNFLAYLLFGFCLFIFEPWQSWTSLYKPGWPRTQRSTFLCLRGAGIKGMHHTVWFIISFYILPYVCLLFLFHWDLWGESQRPTWGTGGSWLSIYVQCQHAFLSRLMGSTHPGGQWHWQLLDRAHVFRVTFLLHFPMMPMGSVDKDHGRSIILPIAGRHEHHFLSDVFSLTEDF